MTRLETVKQHLEEHGYITPGIAQLEYGMTNGLAQRIHDIRGEGDWKIETLTRVSVVSGRTVTRYQLVA
jgi:hypothetical protein